MHCNDKNVESNKLSNRYQVKCSNFLFLLSLFVIATTIDQTQLWR